MFTFLPARPQKGVPIVVGIAITWVATTEFAQASQEAAPGSPFLTLYFGTAGQVQGDEPSPMPTSMLAQP